METLPYYKFWNHTTQRLDFPFIKNESDVPTSLEILQSILETQNNNRSDIDIEDECFIANTERTRHLVENNASFSKPVINVGMPKVGSTTLYSFFQCAGWNVTHSQRGMEMMRLVDQGSPHPLQLSENATMAVDAYAQLDKNRDPPCAYPQIQFLDEIHREYPHATFMLFFRPVNDWIQSAYNWYHLADRWMGCQIPGLQCTGQLTVDTTFNTTINTTGLSTGSGQLNVNAKINVTGHPTDKERHGCTVEDLRRWWCGHVKHIREFTRLHPSHQLLELNLYDGNETSQILSKFFHTNRTCWGHENKHKKKKLTSKNGR